MRPLVGGDQGPSGWAADFLHPIALGPGPTLLDNRDSFAHLPALERAAGFSPLFVFPVSRKGFRAMAKPTTVKIKLVSSEGTGFYYTTKKNPRTQTEKLTFRKYDPVLRKHVDFKEAKIK